MKNWKQYLPDVLAVLLFAVISFAYFFPADIDGKVPRAISQLLTVNTTYMQRSTTLSAATSREHEQEFLALVLHGDDMHL